MVVEGCSCGRVYYGSGDTRVNEASVAGIDSHSLIQDGVNSIYVPRSLLHHDSVHFVSNGCHRFGCTLAWSCFLSIRIRKRVHKLTGFSFKKRCRSHSGDNARRKQITRREFFSTDDCSVGRCPSKFTMQVDFEGQRNAELAIHGCLLVLGWKPDASNDPWMAS